MGWPLTPPVRLTSSIYELDRGQAFGSRRTGGTRHGVGEGNADRRGALPKAGGVAEREEHGPPEDCERDPCATPPAHRGRLLRGTAERASL